MTTVPGQAFTDNLVHFVRYLRARGIHVVPDTTVDLLEAAAVVGLDDRDDVYLAFRAVTVSRREDLAVFAEAFDLFFGSGRQPRRFELDPIEFKTRSRSPVLRVLAPTSVQAGNGEEEPRDLTEQAGAGYTERLARRDFGELTPEEHAEVRRLVARMIWQPAAALSRRWEPARRGVRPDLRRTLRNLVGPSRDLMPLAFSVPRPRRRPLLVVADVSGSMERYVEMLLYFIHAARGRLGRVEAFVFSTRLTRITRELRHRDPAVALTEVGAAVRDWSGGTRIGESLREFNRRWSRRVTRGGPVALVISDGWDRGDPELLRNEMATFARSVHRVVWLNPLAGRPGFAPETRGMRAVLPYVDDFVSAANLRDLRHVVRLLESVPSRRRGVKAT